MNEIVTNTWLWGCVVILIISTFFSLYRSPKSDSSIWLTDRVSIYEKREERVLYIHKWFPPLRLVEFCVSAFDFSDEVGCRQLLRGVTYRSNILDVDVRWLIDEEFNGPIGSSNHRSLVCKIQLDFLILDFTLTRPVLSCLCSELHIVGYHNKVCSQQNS